MNIDSDVSSRHDELLDPYQKDPYQKGNRKWVRITLWVMIIALVSWYFLGGDERSESDERNLSYEPAKIQDTPLAGKSDGPVISHALTVSEPKPVSKLPSVATMARGDEARDVIENLRAKGKINLTEVFRRAEQFREEGKFADAHLMYFFAAKHGHAESALVLGTMYDPEYFEKVSRIVDKSDWTQAHKWYLKAAEGGNGIARDRLESLRKQVERAATRGNYEAGRLVLQWR